MEDSNLDTFFYHVDQSSRDDDEAHIVDDLLRYSINVNLVSLSKSYNIERIFRFANETELFEAGRAWYFLQDDFGRVPLEYLPQGTIVLNSVDAVAENFTIFTNLLHSLSPTQYPGTGPGSILLPQTINAYEAVQIYAQAIEIATNNFTTALTRTALNATIAEIRYDGLGGHIEFEDAGFRVNQIVEIYSVTPQNTSVTIAYAYNDQFYMTTDRVWYPGPTLALPDDQTDFILVPIIWSITSTAIPEEARPWVYNCIKFITELVNKNSTTLPPKTQLSVTLHDDYGDSYIAVKTALTVAPRAPVALFGSLTVPITQAISSVALGYNLTQTSSLLTSSVFSNMALFPSFWRLVSESNFEGRMVMELAVRLGWTDITLVSTADSWAQGVATITINSAQSLGVNLEHHIILDSDDYNYDDAVQQLIDWKSRIVLFEIGLDAFIPLMQSIHRKKWKPVAAVLLDVMVQIPDVALIATSVGLDADFWNGWLCIGPAGGIGPLYDQYVEQTLLSTVPGVAQIGALYALDYDTLTVLGRAVKAVKEAGGNPRNSTAFLAAVKAFRGILPTGNVTFERDGDRWPSFDIRNIRGHTQTNLYRWTLDTGFENATAHPTIYWPDGTTNIPISTLPRHKNWLYWNSGAAIALVTIAALGMAFGVLLLGVFWWYRDSKIIKSATWQFLLIMIIGCIIGAGTSMVWIGRPERYLCALRIWLPPNAFLLILGPLMAKTWRLHRIFSLSHLKVQPITLPTLIFIVVALQLVQIIICIFWISLGNINPVIVNDRNDLDEAYVICGTSLANRVCAYITYSYIGLIIIFGSYLSFKVRKLPKDFNESLWIGRTLYNICLFAVIILILGYALSRFYVVVLILIVVGTLGISLGSMLLMMGHKIFTLWQRPESRLPTTQRDSQGPSSQGGHSSDVHYHRKDYSAGSSTNGKRHEYSVQTVTNGHHSVERPLKHSKDRSLKNSASTTSSSSSGPRRPRDKKL